MKKKKRKGLASLESQRDIRHLEQNVTKKIVQTILGLTLALLIIGSILGYRYVTKEMQPVDAQSTQVKEVEIPLGSSIRQITGILEENQIIRNATIFNYFIKFKNVAGFQAGFYQLSPSMTLDQVLETLSGGGVAHTADVTKVLVREGVQLTDIAQEVASVTPYTAEEFMEKVQDPDFVSQLVAKYPRLLTSSSQSPGVRYVLEGYLFPATYEFDESKTLQMLITDMVAKTDEVLSPYYDQIEASPYSLQEIMAMASLVEKEGVTLEDRKHIAGVFYNRIAAGMMIQSDISVLYALGEHKELVTYEDLEVNSPYNLYMYYGLGPGPYNSPSQEAILASLEPMETQDYYFVADLETGQVYYAQTYEEHLELVAKYVNKE